MTAQAEVLASLLQDGDIESISIGGYSIGTSRALSLAQQLDVDYGDWFAKKLGSRPVCVNHLVLIDYNFGACNFLPYTGTLSIPENVRNVHHIMSTGRMTRGLNHYGVWNPRDPGEYVYFPRHPNNLGPRHGRIPPTNIIAHTANLWQIWNAKGFVAKPILPDLESKWQKMLKDPFLNEALSPTTIADLRKLDIKKGEHPPLELLMKAAAEIIDYCGEQVTAENIMYLMIAVIMPDSWVDFLPGPIKRVITAVLALRDLLRKIFAMPDTQMMLMFSEDGAANSTGAETIFRVSAGHTSDLIPYISDYHFIGHDHLQLGKNTGRVGQYVKGCLSRDFGEYRDRK